MGERKHRFHDALNDQELPQALPEIQFRDEPQAMSVGATLRQRRMALGHELHDIAQILRIRRAHLQAIEDGRYGDLPGPAYATGFIRTYADFLGLDSTHLVVRLKEEVSGKVSQPEFYFPTPVSESRVPGGAVLLMGAVLAVAVYGGWYYMSATGRSLVDFVPPLPERLAALIAGPSDPAPTGTGDDAQAPAVAAVPDDAPGPAAPEPVAPALTAPALAPAPAPTPDTREAGNTAVAERPAEDSPVLSAPPLTTESELAPHPAPAAAVAPQVAEVPPAPDAGGDPGGEAGPAALDVPIPPGLPETPTGTAAAPAPQDVAPAAAEVPPAPARDATVAAAPPPAPPPATAGPQPRIYGVSNGASRIQIQATQDSWVQVRDGNGDLLLTRVLRPGDIYRVPDRPGLRMVTGNAGGLRVLVDGIETPSMGKPGEVLRDVVLDGDKLLDGSAIPN